MDTEGLGVSATPRVIELPVRRWKEGAGIEVVTDRLVAEHTVELAVGDVVLVRIQCLPADLEDLAVGFLLAEGLVEDPKAIAGATISDDGSRVDVDLPGVDLAEITRRVGEMTLASGCGRAVFAAEVRRRGRQGGVGKIPAGPGEGSRG